jgi:hypothetical protein
VGIVASEIVVTALEGVIVDVDIDVVYVYRTVLILPPIAQRRRV